MAFPEHIEVEIPNDGAGNAIVGEGDEVRVDQLFDKGYDYIRDAGAAFTANLEGSVSRKNWTVIVSLAASAQGAIPVHYNFVRIDVPGGGGGALGATTECWASGKSST